MLFLTDLLCCRDDHMIYSFIFMLSCYDLEKSGTFAQARTSDVLVFEETPHASTTKTGKLVLPPTRLA